MKPYLYIAKLICKYHALGFKRMVIKAEIRSEIIKLLRR